MVLLIDVTNMTVFLLLLLPYKNTPPHVQTQRSVSAGCMAALGDCY